MSQLKTGINGWGRIGRLVCRLGFDSLNIKAVNGRCSPETAAHLLKYDSVHGTWDREVSHKKDSLIIDNQTIPYFQEEKPENIPWEKLQVDVVAECTGAFKKQQDLQKHLTGGAKKVLVSAPAEGAELTVVFGVNHLQYQPDKHNLVSLASCTTNCLAPLVKVLQDHWGIKRGFMTTVHSYTRDQRVVDSSHKDLRRARACGLNIVPTGTGAGAAIGKIFPELKGRLQSAALRVPVANVSLVDLTVETEKPASAAKINQAFQTASQGDLKHILALESHPLVSSDFNGRTESSIVDALSTQVLQENLVRVLSWYDNECGFSKRMVDFIHFMENDI